MKKFGLTLIKPKIFIPLVLAIALVALLLTFGDLHKVLVIMSNFQRVYLLYYLLLMIAYEVVRGVQWHYLLKSLEVRVPLRTQIFAFALSEVTKVLPIGNYFQNYVLKESKGADIGRTSAATTLIILEEVVVSLAGVVIFGLGAWTSWVRGVILVGAGVTVVVVYLLARFHHSGERPGWITRHKTMNRVADEFGQFRDGTVDLMHPRALAVTIALSATYLVLAGAALYVVILGLNIQNATFTEALSVYFFSLAVGLMVPIPVDIGVIEVSGLGAFIAVGVERNAALGAVFANRILSILASLAIAIVVMAVLHGEVAPLMKHRRESRRGAQGQDAGNPDVDDSDGEEGADGTDGESPLDSTAEAPRHGDHPQAARDGYKAPGAQHVNGTPTARAPSV